jgi:hypothetical protein
MDMDMEKNFNREGKRKTGVILVGKYFAAFDSYADTDTRYRYEYIPKYNYKQLTFLSLAIAQAAVYVNLYFTSTGTGQWHEIIAERNFLRGYGTAYFVKALNSRTLISRVKLFRDEVLSVAVLPTNTPTG